MDDGGETMQFAPSTDAWPESCDIWDSDSCPDGEKCTAYATMGSSWNANKCVPIMGDKQPGEACEAFGPNPSFSGLDDCDKGSMCWEVAEGNIGYCLAFCSGPPDDPMCEGDTVCSVFSGGVLPHCLPLCDPLLAATDCPGVSDKVCIADPDGGAFVCALAGDDRPYGFECLFANACAPGLACLGDSAVPGCAADKACCAALCDLDAPSCPDAMSGTSCAPWFEGIAPMGYEHVGVCRLP